MTAFRWRTSSGMLLGLVVSGCIPGRTEIGSSRTLGLNVDRSFSSDCSMGVYATHCWTLTIRNQSVTLSGTIDNPIVAMPRQGAPGSVAGIDVAGRYEGQIKPRISPAILIGTPPPVCALVSPIDGPTIATTVVRFRITGTIQWDWGQGYVAASGISQSNSVITNSSLTLQQFDVQNLWSWADAELRSRLRNTVLRAADREIVQKMNEIFALGDVVPAGLPVYAPGYNPYASGGFC